MNYLKIVFKQQMLQNMDLDQPIPPEWRVRGADSHLHSIGLSLFKPQLHPNRRLLYHPLLIFTVCLYQLSKSLILLYYHVTNIELPLHTHVYLGNMDYKFSNEYTSNVIVSSTSIFTIGSQLINYYNYRNGIKPTDLRVFHMICGFISPKSIGIYDQILVHRLCKITKILMKVKCQIEIFKVHSH